MFDLRCPFLVLIWGKKSAVNTNTLGAAGHHCTEPLSAVGGKGTLSWGREVLCAVIWSFVHSLWVWLVSPVSIPAVDFNNFLSDLLPVYSPQFLAKWQATPLLQHNQAEDAALCYELTVWVDTLVWVIRSKWCTRTVQQEVKGNTTFHDADFPPFICDSYYYVMVNSF